MDLNMHNIEHVPKPETQPEIIHCITDGALSEVTVANFGLRFRQGNNTYPPHILGREVRELALVLMGNADTPYLAYHLEDTTKLTGSTSVKERFLNLTQLSLRDHPLNTHFVKFGRGSATWYGFLSNNQDPSILTARGREIVAWGPRERIGKRLKPFQALEKLYAVKDPETTDSDMHLSKKLIAGVGAAMVIAVGASVTYVRHNHKTNS